MSVPSQTPYNTHQGNGVTTTFAFTFYILAAGDLQVSINSGQDAPYSSFCDGYDYQRLGAIQRRYIRRQLGIRAYALSGRLVCAFRAHQPAGAGETQPRRRGAAGDRNDCSGGQR